MSSQLKKSAKSILKPTKIIYGWTLFHAFWHQPLDDKVVFSSFSGKRYGDNPKYISLCLREQHPEIKQVWIYDKKKFRGVPDYIKQVKRGSIEMMRELATAKVWVDSHYLPVWVFKRRNGQFFLETWHGGLGFKKIGFETPETISRSEKSGIKHTAKLADVWLSNSDWLSNAFRKGNLYKGKIIKTGLPKMAYLLKNESVSKSKVREFYGLDKRFKIVVYAPTMRNNAGTGDFSISSDSVLEALKTKFGGKWIMIIRMHPVNEMDGCCKNIQFGTDIINGNLYDDMQDLIAAADVYISDYSSAMFDSAILRHPTFCFAYDLDKYEKERGLCVKISELPFPIARDNNELCKNIRNFSEEKYKKNLQDYFDKVGLVEPDDSAERVVSIIEDFIDENQ